jgi:hypothetical protein
MNTPKFVCDDRVKIVKFPVGDKLNDETGTVLGKYNGGYQVLLDNPTKMYDGWKTIGVVPACLEKI